jgi:hypothetical protein
MKLGIGVAALGLVGAGIASGGLPKRLTTYGKPIRWTPG